MSLDEAHQAELWWEWAPTRRGPGVIYLYSDVHGRRSRRHWMTREGALNGERRKAPSSTRKMRVDGEFLDSADVSVVLAAWQCSNLLLPKCRCPSSARAWPRLLVVSLCAPPDKKLHTGLCLSGENPRVRFPPATPTRRRAGRATRAFGLMCHFPRVASWPPPGHPFQPCHLR